MIKIKLGITIEQEYKLSAQEFKIFTAQITGQKIDYTVASLVVVEDVFDRVFNGLTSQDKEACMWGCGCYLGEILRRSLGGEWIMTRPDHLDHEIPTLLMAPDCGAWPFEQVKDRLDNPGDALPMDTYGETFAQAKEIRDYGERAGMSAIAGMIDKEN